MLIRHTCIPYCIIPIHICKSSVSNIPIPGLYRFMKVTIIYHTIEIPFPGTHLSPQDYKYPYPCPLYSFTQLLVLSMNLLKCYSPSLTYWTRVVRLHPSSGQLRDVTTSMHKVHELLVQVLSFMVQKVCLLYIAPDIYPLSYPTLLYDSFLRPLKDITS